MYVNVYLVINLVNDKKYVGVTSKSVKTRWRSHVNKSQSKNTFMLHKAIKKYGLDNFLIEHIATSRTWEDACQTEKTLICYYDSFNRGYNMTLGGEGSPGRKHSPKTKEKLKIAWKARPQMKNKTKQLLSGCFSSRSDYQKNLFIYSFKGKKHSEYAKQKISESKFKSVQSIDKNDVICTYTSMLDASKQTKVHYSNISNCCLGYRKSAGGYKWRFTDGA